MKTRFSISRCCCACQDCCNGNAPTELDVTIEFDNAMCETCESALAGTFTLQRVEGQLCRWQLIRRKTADGWYEVCNDDYAGYNDEITFLAVIVDIRCEGMSQYRVTATVNLAREYATGSELASDGVTRYDTRNARHANSSYYAKNVNVSEWECNSGSTVTLDWIYTQLQGTLELYRPSPFNSWARISGQKLIIGSPLPPIPPQAIVFSSLEGVATLLISPICQPPTSLDVTGVP